MGGQQDKRERKREQAMLLTWSGIVEVTHQIKAKN